MEVPPVVKNGKFCPVTGKRPTETPILTNPWKTIGIPTPKTNNLPKIVVAFIEMTTKRTSIMINSSIRAEPPNSPYYSTTIAKIKSDEPCGKRFFITLFPAPCPQNPPETMAILARSDW